MAQGSGLCAGGKNAGVVRSAKDNADALALVRQAGTTEIYVLPAAERAEWKKVLLPVQQEFEPVIGRPGQHPSGAAPQASATARATAGAHTTS